MTKYKTTGCFRMLIFLILFVPVAFFGASYLMGDSPKEVISKYFGHSESKTSSSPSKTNDCDEKLDDLSEQIKKLEGKVYDQQQEISKLTLQLDKTQ